MDNEERLARREMIAALREILKNPAQTDLEFIQNRRRDTLQAFMKRHNLNANGWAVEAGVRPTSVYNFIKGYSKSMDEETYASLAAVMNTTAAHLMGESDYTPAVGQALVIGQVQAGNWQKAVTFVDEADATVIPCVLPQHLASRGTRAPVFGLSVVGDSMDQVFPEGTVLVCLPLHAMSGKVKDGDYVVVHRIDLDGRYEATCKQYRLDEGEMWLAPQSSNPRHMPIRGDTAAEDGSQIEVTAIVFGHYSPMAAAKRI